MLFILLITYSILSSCSLVLEISIRRENVTQKVRLQGPSYAGVYIQGRRNWDAGGLLPPPHYLAEICTLNIFPQKTFYSCVYPQFCSPFAGSDINQASMSCRPVPKFSLLLGTVFSYVSHTELSKKVSPNKILIFI